MAHKQPIIYVDNGAARGALTACRFQVRCLVATSTCDTTETVWSEKMSADGEEIVNQLTSKAVLGLLTVCLDNKRVKVEVRWLNSTFFYRSLLKNRSLKMINYWYLMKPFIIIFFQLYYPFLDSIKDFYIHNQRALDFFWTADQYHALPLLVSWTVIDFSFLPDCWSLKSTWFLTSIFPWPTAALPIFFFTVWRGFKKNVICTNALNSDFLPVFFSP